jgi:hypothetical protein
MQRTFTLFDVVVFVLVEITASDWRAIRVAGRRVLRESSSRVDNARVAEFGGSRVAVRVAITALAELARCGVAFSGVHESDVAFLVVRGCLVEFPVATLGNRAVVVAGGRIARRVCGSVELDEVELALVTLLARVNDAVAALARRLAVRAAVVTGRFVDGKRVAIVADFARVNDAVAANLDRALAATAIAWPVVPVVALLGEFPNPIATPFG